MDLEIMDDTGLGILRKLPTFERPVFTISPVAGICTQQYIRKKTKNQVFVNGIFIAERLNLREDEFVPSFMRKRNLILPALLVNFSA